MNESNKLLKVVIEAGTSKTSRLEFDGKKISGIKSIKIDPITTAIDYITAHIEAVVGLDAELYTSTCYVKLISKSDQWYKEGTEVFHYEYPRRLTLEEYLSWKRDGMILVRGIHADSGNVDGESCSLDEFLVDPDEDSGEKEYNEMINSCK